MIIAVLWVCRWRWANRWAQPGAETLHALYQFFSRHSVLVQLLFLFRIARDRHTNVRHVDGTNWFGTLNYAAYESQVYRAALEAFASRPMGSSVLLGMSPLLAFRRIILPQAFRIALPPMTNDFVSLFKDTSVAYVISVWELATPRELANASGQFLLLGVTVSPLPVNEFTNGPPGRRLERRLRNRQALDVRRVRWPHDLTSGIN